MTEPTRQPRLTVAFRLILALPNVIVVVLLRIVTIPVVIAVWCWTLVMAHPPRRLWIFLRGVLQWTARTRAYCFLLAAAYPPFTIHDVPYPVTLALSGPPPRLRRLAVLFRLVLAIPASFLTQALASGAALVSVVAWLCGIVLGRVPRPLHLTLAAVLRYSLRTSAYLQILTPEYPWGVLGDHRAVSGTAESGTLALHGAAKGVAVAALVVGVVLTLANWIVAPVTVRRSTPRVVALQQWNQMSARAVVASNRYRSAVRSCGTRLPCVERATAILNDSVATQIATLRGMRFPTSATRRDAGAVVPLLRREHTILRSVATAPTAPAFDARMEALIAVTRALDRVVRRLANDLSIPQLS